MKKLFLEVIATSMEDCVEIAKTKVNRIELCENMEQSGLTPNYQLIKLATNNIKIPIRVMVRNTSHDFVYTNEEFEDMKNDIKFIKTTKAEGIVIGILTANNTIDISKMQILIELAKPLKITFHRAFDLITDKIDACKQLIRLGVDTILTSGGISNIENNLIILKTLSKLPIQILIGGGINFNNINTLIKLGLNNLHCGSLVRNNFNWKENINLEIINQICEK